ncbi:hypothetical protein D3C83_188430 [compost metagenome]
MPDAVTPDAVLVPMLNVVAALSSAEVESSTFHTPPPTSDTVAFNEPAATLLVTSVASMPFCRAV